MSKEIITVVGARPQFVKAAVVSRALAQWGIVEKLVHTGQHYDDAMSGSFVRDLGMVNIVANLQCGGGSHATQTAKMMVEFEGFLTALAQQPAAVMVYGDTNSTIAAALVASKLHIPVIHVEAGLRSFNREMPEETNRIVTDHLSSLLFCSSQEGVDQLAREGIAAGVHVVGDVMLDAFEYFSASSAQRPAPSCLKNVRTGDFALATIHRPSNTENEASLNAILAGMAETSTEFLWPVHPRLRERIGLLSLSPNVHLIEPQPYLDMLTLLSQCHFVVTDSGGLQKEAYWAKKRCITVRHETEWIETLQGGWNRLFDPHKDDLQSFSECEPTTPWTNLYGDGQASTRIAQTIRNWMTTQS